MSTRDNIMKLACTRVAPESLDQAKERVSELVGASLAGLTFCVFANLVQFKRALDEEVGFRTYEEKIMANGGQNSKVHRLKVVAADQTAWDIWLWETPTDVTVLTVELRKLGSRVNPEDAKAHKEILG